LGGEESCKNKKRETPLIRVKKHRKPFLQAEKEFTPISRYISHYFRTEKTAGTEGQYQGKGNKKTRMEIDKMKDP